MITGCQSVPYPVSECQSDSLEQQRAVLCRFTSQSNCLPSCDFMTSHDFSPGLNTKHPLMHLGDGHPGWIAKKWLRQQETKGDEEEAEKVAVSWKTKLSSPWCGSFLCALGDPCFFWLQVFLAMTGTQEPVKCSNEWHRHTESTDLVCAHKLPGTPGCLTETEASFAIWQPHACCMLNQGAGSEIELAASEENAQWTQFFIPWPVKPGGVGCFNMSGHAFSSTTFH